MQVLDEHISRDGFRLRGTHMSRIDGISDVVFGFAITLLVVSLDVPKDFSQLHALLRGFFPFAVSFLMLMLVWHTHYKFFRRYGLHDVGTMWLNGLLLFCVLFYVYPLKFMFSAAFSSGVKLQTAGEIRELTMLYAAGFTAIYAILAAMYANALHKRQTLHLTPMEVALSRIYFWEEAWNAIIGGLVLVLARVLPAENSTLATLAFMLIAVHRTVLGARGGRCNREFGHVRATGPTVEM